MKPVTNEAESKLKNVVPPNLLLNIKLQDPQAYSLSHKDEVLCRIKFLMALQLDFSV